jgi:hypothetical protein
VLFRVIQNEWLKFRRRRRVLWGVVGIVLLAALITGANFSANRSETRVSVSNLGGASRYRARGPVRSVATAETRVSQWMNVYSLRMARHQSLPPLTQLVRIEETLHRLEVAHPVTGAPPGLLDSTQELLLLRFSAAHHLDLQPTEPFGMSASGLVETAFATAWVIPVGILALLLAADGFAIETAAGTWNSLFMDPVPRGTLLVGKFLWAVIVATAVALLAAALLWGAGRLVFAGGPAWAIENAHYGIYLVHPAGGSASPPYPVPIIRHAYDLHFQTMSAAARDSVLLSLAPLAALVSCAMLLGLLMPSGLASGLAALVFLAGPVLFSQALNGQGWIGLLPGFYLPFGRVLTGETAGLLWPGVGSGLLVSAAWAAGGGGGALWRVFRKEW